MKTSQRITLLAPNFFTGMEKQITALQAAGQDVIRLDIGSPDQPPAAEIIAALNASAAGPKVHGYGAHIGPRSLRQAWADLYQRLYAVELDPDREIVPLIGSKEGIAHLALAVLDPGDVALIPTPAYFTYAQGTLLAGGQPYYMPLRPERGFLPDLAAIPSDVARRARILWLNYPNNPTAAIAPLSFYQEALDFSRQYDLLVCSDASYNLVSFDGYQAPSLLQVPGAKEHAIEFNTLSKSHNMAGWRVGAAMGNPDVLSALFRLKSHTDSGHFTPILTAATQALTGDQTWLEGRNEVYRQRRDRVLETLHALGLPAARPLASIYVWCPVPTGLSATDFASAVLQQALISLTPGTVFGPGGEGFVRIALTASLDRIDLAMQRLQAAWPQLIPA